MDFLRRWFRNLIIDLLLIILVVVGVLIFTKLFYPDALSMLFVMGQFSVGLVNILKLWPIVILMVIVYALPRQGRRR